MTWMVLEFIYFLFFPHIKSHVLLKLLSDAAVIWGNKKKTW